jgi:ketosteroid isomerase-like protein
LGILAAPAARAAESADTARQAAVRQTDRERVQATLAADRPALERLLDDRLRYGHADGSVQTKREFIDALARGRPHYISFDQRDTSIQIQGDTAAVTGLLRLRSDAAGKTAGEVTLRFLAVYTFTDGRWRLFAYQSTQLP